MAFPCSFAGVLTLSLSWTLLEFPINMVGLVSVRDLHFKVDSQFTNLCLTHSETSGVSVVDCVAEITETLDTMIEQRCIELSQENTDVDLVQVENASLWRFREHVASALSLRSGPNFKNADLNQVFVFHSPQL